MNTQKQIFRQRLRLEAKIEKARQELKILQDDCQHPNASKVYRSNTGNYDPSADCYWIEFDCPDCGRLWHEDQ